MIRSLLLSTILAGLVCSCSEGKNKKTVDVQVSGFPRVHPIQLNSLFTSSTGLVSTQNCQDDSMDSIFAMPLMVACETTPLASSILLGENITSDFTCDDYNSDEDAGIFVALMCDPEVPDNLKSLAFKEDGAIAAFSFAQFGSSPVKGVWKKGGVDSYPADFRAWFGESFNDLAGILAVHLDTFDKGKIEMQNMEIFSSESSGVSLVVDFNNIADTGSCAASPSVGTCHSQNLLVYASDSSSAEMPSSFDLRVLADNKENPNFLAIEGYFGYENGFGLTKMLDDSVLNDVASIYFRTIKKGDELFAQMEFRDTNGALLAWDLGNGSDFFELVADGVCATVGAADEFTECETINPQDYSSLWRDPASIEVVNSSPVSASFSGAPTEEGIISGSN